MDCNLELALSTSSTVSTGSHQNGESNPQQEHMTIFYNGNICVLDVTEVQARRIITLACRETAEGMCRSLTTGRANPISSTIQSQQVCTKPQSTLSMKKSLRQFLEKRKHRIQATSPYLR